MQKKARPKDFDVKGQRLYSQTAMIRLLEEYEHMRTPFPLTCINYGSLQDIFYEVVWYSIYHFYGEFAIL